MGASSWVIGDIHGGLAALKQVINRSQITVQDKLIFLGDYVDGWSESAGVVEFLIELGKTYNCVFLKGNHDACCEEWLKTNNMSDSIYEHGGKATIASYQSMDKSTKALHVEFFENLPYHFLDNEKRLFVHAGFTSEYGPVKEFYKSNLIWERTLWEMALAMDKDLTPDSLFFPKRLKLFYEIYIGHTPTTRYNVFEPMNVFNLWNIDTGAGFSGRLTMLNIETKQFWQSDPVNTLYPSQTGRVH